MILGVSLGLAAAFFQALSFIFLRKSLSEFPASMAFFMNAITGFIIWIPFALFTNGVVGDVVKVLPIAILSAVLSEAFVFYALAKGESIVTGVLFSTYPLFTILFAFLLLNESLSSYVWIALMLVIVGTLIVVAPSAKQRLSTGGAYWRFHLIGWPVAAAVAVGIADIAGKTSVDLTSAGTFLIALAIVEVPISLIFLKLQNQQLSDIRHFFTKFEDYKYAFLSGLLGTLTVLALWFTFEALPASVASPITAITPIFVFILGLVFLKETVSIKNTIGLLFVTVGVICVSLMGF